MVVGLQLVFSSFLLSILNINREGKTGSPDVNGQ
jgi:hypothetical protein